MRIGIPVALLFFVTLCVAAQAADLSGTWQADSKPQRVLTRLDEIRGSGQRDSGKFGRFGSQDLV